MKKIENNVWLVLTLLVLFLMAVVPLVSANEVPTCDGANYVFNTNLGVVNPGDIDSENLSGIDLGHYKLIGYVLRGNPNQHQSNEIFSITVGGITGPISYDDPDPDAITERYEDLGSFDFTQGTNEVFMNAEFPSGTNSVNVDEVCLFKLPNICGDGIVGGSEQCDDGNTNNWDTCTNSCEDVKILRVNSSLDSALSFDFNVVSGECEQPDGHYNTNQDFKCSEGSVVKINNVQQYSGNYYFDKFVINPSDDAQTVTDDSAEVIINCYDDTPNVIVTLNYLEDTDCPNVEVISPPDSNPVTWYGGNILTEATVSDPSPSSGIDEVTVGYHDQINSWFDGWHNMVYDSNTGFYEYNWSTAPNLCSFVLADVYGKDNVGHRCGDTNQFAVDNLPPVTTKTWSNPYVKCAPGENCDLYVTPDTEFTLSATDAYSTCSGSGVNETYYKVDGGDTNIYDGEFSLQSGCNQVIEYWSVDNVGNVEEHQNEIDNVDTIAPVTTKTFDGPTASLDDDANYFVTTSTQITLTAVDQSPDDNACPVGIDYLNYEIWWDSDNDTVVDTLLTNETVYNDSVTFNFNEESIHEIRWYAVDLLGNKEEMHYQKHAVDDSAPSIDLMVTGPVLDMSNCPPNDGEGTCQINGVTLIHVNSSDVMPHPSGRVLCDWDYEILDGHPKLGHGQSNVSAPFTINFPEESKHELTVSCYDILGNTNTVTEVFNVDKTEPETTVSFGDPKFVDGEKTWINTSTQISLNATDDIGPHDSGIAKTSWRITKVDNSACEQDSVCQETEGNGTWNEYNNVFYSPEESCHLIEYYSVDGVNKTETVKKKCVYVENQAPVVNKTVGEPKIATNDSPDWGMPMEADVIDGSYYINSDTPITLSCNDLGPHPVGHVNIYYKYYWDNEPMSEGWQLYTKPLHFQDSYHELYYYCEDALGNKGETHYELDIVDSQAPITTKMVSEPKLPLCDEVLVHSPF